MSDSSSNDMGKPGDLVLVESKQRAADKFKKLLPESITVTTVATGKEAVELCKSGECRGILINESVEDVAAAVLVEQLRALQPQASFFAVCLPTRKEAENEMRNAGFDGVLYKPFSDVGVADVLSKCVGTVGTDLIRTDEELMTLRGFAGPRERMDRYFSQLLTAFETSLDELLAECYDSVIVDLREIPLAPERTPRFIRDIRRRASKSGIDMSMVATEEGQTLFEQFAGLAENVFTSVDAAREQ